jgi:hypothetical protein
MKSKTKTNQISDLKIKKVSNIDLNGFDEYVSSLDLNRPQLVREQLVEHFLNGEHETFFEILALYINHVGKTTISKETNIPERTIYNFINGQHKTSSENVFKVMEFLSKEVEKKTA